MVRATQYKRQGDSWVQASSRSVKLAPGLPGGKATVNRDGAWQREAYYQHLDGRPANLARSWNFDRLSSWLGMD